MTLANLGQVYLADCLELLPGLTDGSVDLIYLDPPFNTGRERRYQIIRSQRSQGGYRGFAGHRYLRLAVDSIAHDDRHPDYLTWIRQCLIQAHRLLKFEGSIFVHLDRREVHYVKVMMDEIFGRDCFQNEIIWAYDFGGRSRRRWPAKHDTILWYSRHSRRYTFHYESVDRTPYLAPNLVSPDKAARRKTLTDVWWNTIVPTNSKERVGYPGQKPLAILERIVKVHSSPGELILDFVAGSGTTGEAAARHGRRFLLVDQNPVAVDIMERRLSRYGIEVIR